MKTTHEHTYNFYLFCLTKLLKMATERDTEVMFGQPLKHSV